MVKVPFAPSQNTLENLQVALAARSGAPALAAAELILTPALENAAPLMPAVLVPSPPSQPRVVFGANAVSRYLGSLLKRTGLSVGEQDVMDVEEIVLRPAIAKVLKSRVALDFFGDSAASALSSFRALDKKLGAALDSAVASIAAIASLDPVMSAGMAATSASSFSEVPLGLLVVAPSVSLALRLLGDAAAAKYASLSASAAAIVASPLFAEALAAANAVSATARAAEATPATASSASAAATGPVVEIDVAANGLMSSLRKLFTDAVVAAFPQASALGIAEAVVTKCTNEKFGDYQCNNAMALGKALKGMADYSGPSAPKDVAAQIVARLTPSNLVQSTTVMPNGFINIHLSNAALVSSLAKNLTGSGVVRPSVARPLKVLVDFSSPNIAKEMHVGHLRSTIIGDTICRVLEFCGHEVMRVNHVGDWGTQFGMLISYLQDEFPDILTNPPNISDLTVIYKAAKKRFDDDAVFKERSRLNVVKLQSGDEACNTVWRMLCDISRREFQVLYDALGVKLTEVGESFYNPMIPTVIQELEKLGLVREDGGMLICMLEAFDIPLILRKSDGGYGYDSTDMAAVKYRLADLNRDWVICITDAGQAGHFDKVFKAARAAGWVGSDRRLDHIGFGVVQGEDGKKFKTRSGDTVKLIDLLNSARDEMMGSLKSRAEEGKSAIVDEAEILDAATKMGYGAVKYFDLKQNPTTNYIFNYQRMLDTRGDTAIYLLFAYARLASILRKAHEEKGVDVNTLLADAGSMIALDNPAERALAFELMQFGDVITAVLEDLSPNRICDYLSSVSIKFTDFVTKCNVLNSEELKSRLLLCECTKRIMAQCFYLLGISTLERI